MSWRGDRSMCCSTRSSPKSASSCRACPQRARRVFRAARRSFQSTGSWFGSQGSGRCFRASCRGIRPWSRMKPGKFQQIGPKMSSIRRHMTNQCFQIRAGRNGQINQRSRLARFCSSRARSIREAVTQNSRDLAASGAAAGNILRSVQISGVVVSSPRPLPVMLPVHDRPSPAIHGRT